MSVEIGFEQQRTPRTPIAHFEALIGSDEAMDTMLSTVYTDSDQLVDALEVTGKLLPTWGLGHLAAFNTAYLSLSSDVRDAVRRGPRDPSAERNVSEEDPRALQFLHPKVVEQTMGIFAELYFRQIRMYRKVGMGRGGGTQGVKYFDEAQGIKGVDEAWRPLFSGNAGKNASPGIQFLLGMNAHIVYDLPQALGKSLRIAEAKDERFKAQDYYDDYIDVVGRLIDQVAKELAPAYVPGTNKMRNFLTAEVVKRIADWREDAWNAGRQLLAVIGSKEERAGYSQFDIRRGRVAAKGIMRECKRRALRNARMIGVAGRAALTGVAAVGGEPPMKVTDLMEHRRRREAAQEQFAA